MKHRLLHALRRDLLLSLTTVATLVIGIGVATALYLELDVFLHPRLQAPDAERVVSLYFGTREEPRGSASHAELERLRATSTFADAVGSSAIGGSLGTATGSRFAWGHFVSGDFFRFFGARPELGRLIARADDAPGASPALVLADSTWRSLFGADPAIVGRVVNVNGVPLTVIGVVEPRFVGVGYASSFFVPLVQSDRISGVERLASPEDRWLEVLARLPAGRTVTAASAELQAIAAELDRALPLADGPRGAVALAATGFDPESSADPLYRAARALTAAAVLFLLLAAANIAGLMLARVARHEREWALRKALGASPARLLRVLLGDVTLPVAVGIAGGLALASLLAGWIERMLQVSPGGIGPGWFAPGQRFLVLDTRAVTFAILAAVTCTVLALVAPAVRVLRTGRDAWTSGDARSGVRLGLRRGLVVIELAVAVVLLVGGALLASSLFATLRTPLGFATDGLVEATVYVPRAGGAAVTAASWSRILAGVRLIPSVESATLAHIPPNSGALRSIDVTAGGPGERHHVGYNIVDPGYLETLGIPLLSGRGLSPADASSAHGVVVVNEALARRLFGTPAAVGQHLETVGSPIRPGEPGPGLEVVGVVADAATASVLEPHDPTMFFVYGQRRHSRLTLVLRSRDRLAALEPALRAAITRAAPEAAIIDLVTVEEQGLRSAHSLQVNADIAGGLAALAMLTALVGLFALQLFAVSSRRHELGVRLALGARGTTLARLVLGDGLRLAILGSALGLAGAFAAQRLLASLLVGLTGPQPWIYVMVPIAAVLVTVAASWIPARQAMRTDPVVSLGR